MNPVGVVETPEDFRTRPRDYPFSLRLGAVLLLAAFPAVVVVTTVYSLASYCLTTFAGAPPFVPLP